MKKTAKKDAIIQAAHENISAPPQKGLLGKLAKQAKPHQFPVHDDAKAELKRLVRMHNAMTRMSVSTKSPAEDRKNRATGETIPSLVPEDLKVIHRELSAAYKRKATELEAAMTRELRKLPIYKVFMQDVFGLGPVVSAYLAAEIDFLKCEKPSQLKRYCGFAVINGRLERPTRGIKLGYNASLRTRIFQMMSALWKNAAKYTICKKHEKLKKENKPTKPEEKKAFAAECRACSMCQQTDAPLGYTSKYLDVWKNYKHRMQHSERVWPETNEIQRDGQWVKGARAAIHSGGWHKAADVFLEDLYIIGRALAQKPVWPSYYAAKLGYEHLGKVSVNAPKFLMIDEALALVGDVGAKPAMAGPVVLDDEEDDGLEAEIERAEREETEAAE